MRPAPGATKNPHGFARFRGSSSGRYGARLRRISAARQRPDLWLTPFTPCHSRPRTGRIAFLPMRPRARPGRLAHQQGSRGEAVCGSPSASTPSARTRRSRRPCCQRTGRCRASSHGELTNLFKGPARHAVQIGGASVGHLLHLFENLGHLCVRE
jgi:hypothetical protein